MQKSLHLNLQNPNESADITKNLTLELIPLVVLKRLNINSPSFTGKNNDCTVKCVSFEDVPQSKVKRRKILKNDKVVSHNHTIVAKRNGSRTRFTQSYLNRFKAFTVDEDAPKQVYVDLEKTWESVKTIQRDLGIANAMHYEAADKTEASSQDSHTKTFIKPESIIFQVNSLMNRDLKNPKQQLGLYTGWDYNRCSASPALCESHHKEETVPKQLTECFITLKNQLAYTTFLDNGLYTLTTWTSPQEYFSPLLLRILLNLIMTVRDESQVKCVEGAISRHWSYHPPCRPGMVKVYTEFLMATIIDVSLAIELSGQIMPLILKQLEEEFDWLETHIGGEDEKKDLAKKPNRVLFKYSYEALKEREKKLREEGSSEPLIHDFVLESDEEDEIYGHFRNTQFVDLKHRVRLERLTIVLRLIVDLVEQDMVVWLGKYSSDPCKAMESEETNPLIARVLWRSTHLAGTTNDICLQIFELLHKTGTFPELRMVFLRCIALLAETFRVSEKNLEHLYPHFGDCCDNLVSSFSNTFSSVLTKEELQVVKMLKPNWFRLLVAWFLLNKSLGMICKPTLESALHVIRLHLKKGKMLPAKGKDIPSQQHLVMLENRIPVIKLPKLLICDNEPVTYPSKRKDINKHLPTGETLLSFNCKKNKINDVIGILCHPDIDVNISDVYGYTPLHKAVVSNAIEIVKALLNYVPIKEELKPVNLRARLHGRTLLMDAVMCNHVEIAKLILDASGPVALTDEDDEGCNVLAMATTSEMKALIGTAVASDSDHDVRLTLKANQLELLITFTSAYLDVYRIKELCFKLQKEKNCIPQSTDKLNTTTQFDYDMFSKAVSCFRNLRRFIRKLHKRIPDSQLIAHWLILLED